MDLSGCKQPFPATELQKCLEPHTIDLWQRISQAQDIAAAQLEGLEHCPKCEFCMIFEVGIDVAPDLICLKSDCGFISCRSCKQKVFVFSLVLLTGVALTNLAGRIIQDRIARMGSCGKNTSSKRL